MRLLTESQLIEEIYVGGENHASVMRRSDQIKLNRGKRMDRRETDDVFCVRNLNFNPNLATLKLKLDSREQANS